MRGFRDKMVLIMEKENEHRPHEGHRKRLYQKLKEGENFYEHELLEMLLFNAYPRKNTNPVAHALLARFPSIQAVFDASVDELKAVEGVGESVALYLKCVGLCVRGRKTTDNFGVIRNYGDFIRFAKLRLCGHTNELLEIYPVDKAGRVLRIFRYTVGLPQKVEVDPARIMSDISLIKPHGLFVAHNHVAGGPEPSAADDRFTKQLQLICSMSGVSFHDHCILCNDGSSFSYYYNGKIDRIKDAYTIDYILNNVDLLVKNEEEI